MSGLPFEQAMMLLRMRGGGKPDVTDWVHRIRFADELVNPTNVEDYELDGRPCVKITTSGSTYGSGQSKLVSTVANGTGVFSIVGWYHVLSGTPYFVALGARNKSSDYGIRIYSTTVNNSLRMFAVGSGNTVSYGTPEQRQHWRHIALVHEGSGVLRFYCDGIQRGAPDGIVTDSTLQFTSAAESSVKEQLYLHSGGYGDRTGGDACYWDVRTYARALSADEIVKIYNATKWE